MILYDLRKYTGKELTLMCSYSRYAYRNSGKQI